MTRLVAYLLFAGLSVGAGLAAVDSARFTARQIDEMNAVRCAKMNSVLPGSCQMP